MQNAIAHADRLKILASVRSKFDSRSPNVDSQMEDEVLQARPKDDI